MADAVYSKLAFNGYHVTFWNHETHTIEEKIYPTYDSVMARGWGKYNEPFPSPEDFAEDLFNVYGDCVGKITDTQGHILYDKMQEMFDTQDAVL